MVIRDFRIGIRLSVGFAVILALLTLMSVIGVLRLTSIDDATEHLVNELLLKERLAGDWLLATQSNAIRAEAIARSGDAVNQAYFQQSMDSKSGGITALQKKLEALLEDPAEKKLFAEVVARRATYIDKRKAVVALKSAGNDEEAKRAIDSVMMPALTSYVGSIEAVQQYYKTQINSAHQSINDDYRAARLFIILAAVSALLAGIFLAWYLTVGITRPLTRALDLARLVAEGDLSAPAQIHAALDETGQLLSALHDMQENLVRTIQEIRSGTETIATASNQIAVGNLDLSSRTEEQAGSLGQTASSMDQLTSTVRQSADNARQANQMVVSAAEFATKGGAMVHQVMSTMDLITASSRQMTDIISVIDGIAFQTNILALNASVEAARAGEQGRGFAVVASEVRNLAQRSATAAKEIKALIGASEANIKLGSKLVHDTGATMNDIVESVRHVTDIMSEIMAATQEQTTGIEHVNQAISEMDSVTQQNAALVEQAAAAADSLRDQAASLDRIVGVFRLHESEAPLAGKTIKGLARGVRPTLRLAKSSA
jgi:methyl-accepting chemotaxis protein